MLNVDCQLTLPGQTLSYQLKTPDGITCLGIKGDSGCGKTTLLRIIAGLEQHVHGNVEFAQQQWQHSQQKKFVHASERNIGFVFQDARLFAHLSVAQNIQFKGNKRALPGFEFERVIETLDVGHLLSRRPANLSGGEKQRVAIARALSSQPRYLMFDEPLTGIDHNHKVVILNYLAELKHEYAIPMIYVSHLDDELQKISDGIINLNLKHKPFTTLINSNQAHA